MQAIKGLVVVLGVLIVVSFGLLIYGFATRISGSGAKVDGVDEAAAPAAPVSGFGEARLTLPGGCAVEEMRPDGARLYVRLGPAGSCARIVVLDSATGRPVGTIVIGP